MPKVIEAVAYSSGAMTEIDAFFTRTGKVIVPLTIDDILARHEPRDAVACQRAGAVRRATEAVTA